MGKGHGVRFVAHAHALQPILTGIFERVTDDALDAFAGIHVLLNGDFVRCAFLEEAPDSHIEAFGVLAEDHQADVFLGAVAQRRKAVVKQFDGSGVDVEVELKAQAQQNVGRMLIGRHARVAQRAEEDGVKLIAQHLDRTRRQRYAFAKVFVRAPVELDKFNGPSGWSGGRPEHLHGLRSNFRPDAVAGNYRDAGCRTAISQGNAGQGLASSTVRHPLARGYSSIKVHRQFTRSVGGLCACPRGYNVICGRGKHARMQMNR